MDEPALEAALYRRSRASDWPEVDWASVEKALSDRSVTLMLLREECRETHLLFGAWVARRSAR